VILLLTDGEDHQSDPVKAAKEAAKRGIRIYSVGIGSRSGEPIPQLNEDGSIAGYLQKDGKPVTTRLDAKTLRSLADLTGGAYFEMEPRRFGVEPILAKLAKLKRSEIKSRLIKHYDEIYFFFLFPAFLLLLIDVCLSERRRQGDREAWVLSGTVSSPSSSSSSSSSPIGGAGEVRR
jgi:Ca-activated chloride channel family protein